MSAKEGQLLWNRRRITLQAGVTDVATGLKQVSLAFNNSSVNEPSFNFVSGSRVQVIPLAPTVHWISGDISHSEPYLNADGTIHVIFTNSSSPAAEHEINVLFWNPHTLIGPGTADVYSDL